MQPDDPSAGATNVDFEFTFSADTDIPQNSYVEITLPNDITLTTDNTVGTCANLFDTSQSLTCTVSTNSAGETVIKVEGLFPDAENSG